MACLSVKDSCCDSRVRWHSCWHVRSRLPSDSVMPQQSCLRWYCCLCYLQCRTLPLQVNSRELSTLPLVAFSAPPFDYVFLMLVTGVCAKARHSEARRCLLASAALLRRTCWVVRRVQASSCPSSTRSILEAVHTFVVLRLPCP